MGEADWVGIETITPWDKNPRKNDKAVDAIAKSITRFGWGNPIIVRKADGVIVAGHTRWKAAKKLGLDKVLVRYMDLDPAQAKALALADNKLGELADWDDDALAEILAELKAEGADVLELGWQETELARLFKDAGINEPDGSADDVPEVVEGVADSRAGQVYELGPHRLLCGDSTSAAHVASLFAGLSRAALLHADPPYGMGKEADGVLNDNLYADKLDAFQLKWWQLWSGYCEVSCTAYIWGNAPELWRLWYGGLSKENDLVIKNEIVWNKGSGFGMGSKEMRSFSTATERALLIMRGPQEQNINADNYWEGWEPIRGYLDEERIKMGWSVSDVNRLTKTKMASHWFTKSQWTFPTLENYKKIQGAANGAAFLADYEELKSGHEGVCKGFEQIRKEFQEGRAYFDASWEPMTDVWDFPRVFGEERHGHATPKPVAMIARAIRAACPHGGLVAEPFGGSGTTLIAAAEVGRVAVVSELDPKYCDVIRRRWTKYARERNLEVGSGGLE